MASVLRAMAEFGDAAGWPIAAVVVVYFARRIVAENDRAHTELRGDIAELRSKLDTIAVDVAVLRDRAER